MSAVRAGIRVVITRPQAQANPLAARLATLGAAPLVFSAMEIESLPDVPWPAIAERLQRSDFAVFISPNAVLQTVPAVLAQGPWPTNIQVVALGAGSAQSLQSLGIATDVVPSQVFDSERLLALPQLQYLTGRRVTIFRGLGGRELLAQTLEARGAAVEQVACYRRAQPQADSVPLRQALAAGAVDALSVTSSEGLQNLLKLLDGPAADALRQSLILVPHPRIAQTAQALGCGRVRLTAAGDAGLIAALTEIFPAHSL